MVTDHAVICFCPNCYPVYKLEYELCSSVQATLFVSHLQSQGCVFFSVGDVRRIWLKYAELELQTTTLIVYTTREKIHPTACLYKERNGNAIPKTPLTLDSLQIFPQIEREKIFMLCRDLWLFQGQSWKLQCTPLKTHLFSLAFYYAGYTLNSLCFVYCLHCLFFFFLQSTF